ncbi:MAG: hypothetical protein ABI560_15340 [Myxococcales bacterium]
MRTISFSVPARCAAIALFAVVGGACASSSSSDSATGGKSGATGGSPGSGGATGGSTNPGTGGSVTATGGADATGGSSGTGGATGGSTNPGTGGGVTATGGTAGGAGAPQGSGGTAGASSNGGTSGGCGAAAFCDDFERSTMLGAEWMLDNSVMANTIVVESTQHHSGMNAVHIKYGTGAMATYLDAAKGFPFASDSYWGRVWMYAMTGLESGHHVYIEARAATGSTGVRALNTQGTGKIATNLESSDGGGTSTVSLPQAKWTCFEWHIMGGVHLYMDGTEVPGTAQTNWTIPHMTKQRIGVQRYGGGTAGELWYDDYAVGTDRIGCN